MRAMAAFWPAQPDENPVAAHLNATPKYVATHTLSGLTWSNAQVLLRLVDCTPTSTGVLMLSYDRD